MVTGILTGHGDGSTALPPIHYSSPPGSAVTHGSSRLPCAAPPIFGVKTAR